MVQNFIGRMDPPEIQPIRHHTFKNVKMPGHMGNERVTVQNLKVVRIDPSKGLVLIRGAIPGPRNCDVLVRKAIKKS